MIGKALVTVSYIFCSIVFYSSVFHSMVDPPWISQPAVIYTVVSSQFTASFSLNVAGQAIGILIIYIGF